MLLFIKPFFLCYGYYDLAVIYFLWFSLGASGGVAFSDEAVDKRLHQHVKSVGVRYPRDQLHKSTFISTPPPQQDFERLGPPGPQADETDFMKLIPWLPDSTFLARKLRYGGGSRQANKQ